MGELPQSWPISGRALNITLCVTENCNLRCKYCYETGKNSENRMTVDTAKKVVDYVLSNYQNDLDSVVWDFIGGEPLLEIDMIDVVCDYIKSQMYLNNHQWFNSYRFSFSTNGILYSTPKVQNFIKKNRDHISIGISVDGNKTKHDLQRIKPDGSGSYDDVVKNVPLWIEQFPNASTKATFSHDDLPHLKDSIISLWELGIKMVAANVVFEDVWEEGDDEIFETQLKELGDYILDNQLWEDYSVRFFDPSIGFPLEAESLKRNFCGSGSKYMLSFDTKGKMFPCIRFMDFSLNTKKGIVIGDIENGIETDKLRPFKALTLENQSPDECISCEVASGCAWCTGTNYDTAKTNTIYERATFICNMHKANVRANKYFWDRYSEITGDISPRKVHERSTLQKQKYLQIITSDNITPHCSYSTHTTSNNFMNEEVYKAGIDFAQRNDYTPVILKDDSVIILEKDSVVNSTIPIYRCGQGNMDNNGTNCILLVTRDKVCDIYNSIVQILKHKTRVNIVLEDMSLWDDDTIKKYEEALRNVSKLVLKSFQTYRPLEVNALTDMLYLNSEGHCDAGENSFALAPNGKIYYCPAFYFMDPDNSVGDLINGINIIHVINNSKANMCTNCTTRHCKRCIYLNKLKTNELSVSPKNQCIIANIERNITSDLQANLLKQGLIDSSIKQIIPVKLLDPLERMDQQVILEY